ncbi:MAG: tetratricopeptide repeat protein, partial [Candidatus Delongbacteria bacterium]|nr:tetratricopeptide repeat protein [Candidatus Delongbacteria bacterium]
MKQIKELENVLDKTTGKDKFKILNHLSEVYEKISVSKSIEYALESVDLLQFAKGNPKKADIFIRLGNLHKQSNEYDKALTHYHTALDLLKSAK